MSFKFQAIDWRSGQDLIFNENHKVIGSQFIIEVFGRDEDNNSVYLKILNFRPCFYIIQDEYYYNNKQIFKELKGYNDVIETKNLKYKNFYGFKGGESDLFTKFESEDYYSLKKFGNQCAQGYDKKRGKQIIKIPLTFKTFELNKDPIIQFVHYKNLNMCGWIEVDNYDYIESDTNAYTNICADYNDINLLEGYESKIQKFIIGAMDIECVSDDGGFPQSNRETDKIVSIATTFSRVGEEECYKKCILVLESKVNNKKIICPPIDNAIVINCKTESELILRWCQLIQDEDPDIMTNWNGFGFDDKYIYERAQLLGIEEDIKLSRILNHKTKFTEKTLASSAMGDNVMHYYDMKGRVNFDLMKFIQREHKLDSYKLDYAASYFFRELVYNIKYDKILNRTNLYVNKTKEFNNNQYIIIIRNDGVTDYEYNDEVNNKHKFQIINVDRESNIIIVDGYIEEELIKEKGKVLCCNVKDDVKPQEIFRKYKYGTEQDIKELSQYNIQDCNLCNKIINKLNIIINNIGMANVCNVPLNWIFNRGQSPKVFSIVGKKCLSEGYLIPTLVRKEEDEDEKKITFEGACVLTPNPGLYECIFTLDYAALYPRSIICRNISHEMYVMDTQYMDKYKDEYKFNKIEYKQLDALDVDTHKSKTASITNSNLKGFINLEEKDKTKTCYFAVKKDGTMGLIPQILSTILQNRAAVRKKQKEEKDPFKWTVLEGLQLAYKVTANSVYGQLGCENVGPIALMDLAACTTATGREMIRFAKYFAEDIYSNIIKAALISKRELSLYLNNMFKTYNKINGKRGNLNTKEEKLKFYTHIYDVINEELKGLSYNIKVIYGDTDSIMVNMDLRRNGVLLQGLEMRSKYIKLGDLASQIINEILPKPEELEYEKILSPFLILSKKRYVGNLYEFNPNKYYQKNMGIVLKRRDNAHIVKYVVGGVVDKLINTENIEEGKRLAFEFAEQSMKDMIDDKFKINMFVVSKTLKKDYKNRLQIAHAVLADRIAARDPGNAPAPNDRIPYVYIVTDRECKLQGDKIETPDYIKEKKLHINYDMYITNQIKEPCSQFLNLFDVNRTKKLFEDINLYFKETTKGFKRNNILNVMNKFKSNNISNDDDLFNTTF